MGKRDIKDFYNKTAQQWADKFYADDEHLPVLLDFMGRLPDCSGNGIVHLASTSKHYPLATISDARGPFFCTVLQMLLNLDTIWDILKPTPSKNVYHHSRISNSN